MEKLVYVTNTSSVSTSAKRSVEPPSPTGEGLIEIYAALSTVVKPRLNFQLSIFNFQLFIAYALSNLSV